MTELHSRIANNGQPSHLMLLEHKPVITYTESHMFKSMTSSNEEIISQGIDLALADRGGDTTFHGPGQLVGYPLVRLNGSDVVAFVRALESALITSCLELGIKDAISIKGFTGVWVRKKVGSEISLRKIIAIGVGFSKNTTKHGFAFNLDIDYRPFLNHIFPCGLKDKRVTSLKEVLQEEGLEMPNYLVILKILCKNIAEKLGLFYGEHKDYV